MIRLLLTMGLALLSLLPGAQSGDETINLAARAGFDGLYKESTAVPVVIDVDNRGPSFDGEIRVAVGGEITGAPTIYSAPVALPTGSDKRVILFVNMPTFGSDLDVTLYNGDVPVAETTVRSPNRVPRYDVLYGVISPEPGAMAFLDGVAGLRGDAAAAFLELADLPDVSSAWNALDVIVLDDVDTTRLTADQLVALRAWVESGGQLVVTGGAGALKTGAALTDLLPVTLTGTESIEDLTALADFTGATLPGDGPYLVAGSSLARGELLLHQDGLPLLARNDVGLGSVYFLALDPKLTPLAGWSGSETLWDEIARNVPDPRPWSNGINDGFAAYQVVAGVPGLRLPSTLQLVAFLLLYILVVGPVNYLVLRRLKRPELAWVTIPLLVLLFTGATYLTGFRTRGASAVLNEMAAAYGSVEGNWVRSQTVTGLYSPRRGDYDVTLPYNSTVMPFAQGLGTSFGATNNFDRIERAGALALRRVRTDTGEIATFLIDAHLPRPALEATARLVDNGTAVEGTVRNVGDATFENAVFIFGQDQLALGDLAPGEERSAKLPLRVPAGQSQAESLFAAGSFAPDPLINDPSYVLGTTEYYSDPKAYSRWQLIQSLYTSPDKTAVRVPDPATEAITLAGWIERSDLPISVNTDRLSQTATTLYLLEVPVR